MPANDAPIVYWDTNVFIAFMKKEENRVQDVEYLIKKTEAGELIIITSPFTLTETYKIKDKDCHELFSDVRIFFKHENRRIVNMDSAIGFRTQELRNNQSLSWQDSVHIATALEKQVDFFLTYDGESVNKKNPILNLNDSIQKSNSKENLKIITPHVYVQMLEDEAMKKQREKEERTRKKEIEKVELKDKRIGQIRMFADDEESTE